MTKSRVAAAHAAPVFLDSDGTIDKACSLVANAGEQSVDLIVFPEVFVPGFPYWINCYPPVAQLGLNTRYGAESINVPGPEIQRVQAAARAAGTYVVLGISEADNGTLYNSQVHIDQNGNLLGTHRKLQPTFAERYIWGQGDGSTLHVFDTALGKIGGLACWEHTMNLARHALILKGEQIHAASWPSLASLAGFESAYDSQVEAMCRNHAITGQCFVVVAESPVVQADIDGMEAELGPQDIQKAGGAWSAIIHPMTHYIAGPHTGSEETLVIGEINLGDIAFLKNFVDAGGHYSRRDVLRLVVDEEPKVPLERRHPQEQPLPIPAPAETVG